MANINLLDNFSSIIFTSGNFVSEANFFPRVFNVPVAAASQIQYPDGSLQETFTIDGNTYSISFEVEHVVYVETDTEVVGLIGNDLYDDVDYNGSVYGGMYFDDYTEFMFLSTKALPERTILNALTFGTSFGSLVLNENNIIVTETFDNQVQAMGGNDWIIADDGSDTLLGGTGYDTINGGYGNDFLNGEAGNDVLFGEEDDDDLIGGAGNDQLFGGKGNDSLAGDGGADTLYGEAGSDNLDGGSGNDLLYGNEGSDALLGGSGKDKLYGGAGIDRLNGGTSGDYLYGGDSGDFLSGDGGWDKLIGGKGDDLLSGGDGHDRFIFSGRAGYDAISDFNVEEDTIVLRHTGRDSVDDLRFTEQGNDVLVGYGKGKILLMDTTLDEATHAHFEFG